jgi:NDP-sugar pyrophosphorylase family protein
MTDVIILAGGFGTRLAGTLPGVPKILAPICGIPFVEILLRWLRPSGRVVFALGHLAAEVQRYLGSREGIEFSVEKTPLGTGGALLQALPKTMSSTVLVMNGDSFFDISLSDFHRFHASHGEPASIASLKRADVRRYGSLTFDEKSGRVVSTEPSGWISAGFYLLNRSLLTGEALRSCSLETELMPHWIEKGIFAYRNPKTFIDIGTAESYRDAQKILGAWI